MVTVDVPHSWRIGECPAFLNVIYMYREDSHQTSSNINPLEFLHFFRIPQDHKPWHIWSPVRCRIWLPRCLQLLISDWDPWISWDSTMEPTKKMVIVWWATGIETDLVPCLEWRTIHLPAIWCVCVCVPGMWSIANWETVDWGRSLEIGVGRDSFSYCRSVVSVVVRRVGPSNTALVFNNGSKWNKKVL